MFRPSILFMAALLASAPLTEAAAQSRERFGGDRFSGEMRQNRAREESRDGQRIDGSEAVQRVRAGRSGHMVPGGFQDRGDTFVVRWEYPDGRIADIVVDARTGRIIRDR